MFTTKRFTTDSLAGSTLHTTNIVPVHCQLYIVGYEIT